MLPMDDFHKLQARVESITRKRDQASGALQEVLKQMKTEFGVSGQKESQAKLKELNTLHVAEYSAYVEARKSFDELWADKLGDL